MYLVNTLFSYVSVFLLPKSLWKISLLSSHYGACHYFGFFVSSAHSNCSLLELSMYSPVAVPD